MGLSASPSRPWRPSAPHSQTARAVWEPCVFHLRGRSESARHQDVRSANMLGAAVRRLAPARKRGGAGAAVIWPSASPSRPWRPSAPHSQTARAVWEPCVFHLRGRSESARHQDVRSANMLGAAVRRLAPARKRGGAGAAVIWPSASPSRPWRPSAPPLFCCGPFPGRWAGR